MTKQIVYVTGLPRSGSTLLCQLLGMHPDIHSPGHSSPLAHTLEHIRQSISSNNFFLSQLDCDFHTSYNKLKQSYIGFIQGWLGDTNKPIVVDKNRNWLGMLQTVYSIDPEYKMIVCIRDLVQLYGSIDKQHKDTILISYSDPNTTNSSWYRADQAYSTGGVVGAPLRALENLQDIDESYRANKNIYFIKYEDLIGNTSSVLADIAKFLDVCNFEIDFNNLAVKKHESDSHYRFKFRHNTHSSLLPINEHKVPIRIASEIVHKFRWYFDYFYPSIYTDIKKMSIPKTSFGSKQGDSHGQA